MVAGGLAREAGFRLLALTVDYNQRHRIELEAARRYRRARSAPSGTSSCRSTSAGFGGSALTDDIAVPKQGLGNDIPVTYVPARNTIFLSLCLGWAEAAGARDLFIGVNALDYSGYPDCRPEFIAAFEQMAEPRHQGRRRGRGLHRPDAADRPHQGRDRRARRLGSASIPAMSWSCYDPTADLRHCGLLRFLPPARQGLCRGGLRRPDRLCDAGGWRMSYAVKEIFLTLQGEGMQAGRRAVFLRFAGCNLWSGREQDRAEADCNFCDTDFVGTDGINGGRYEAAGARRQGRASSGTKVGASWSWSPAANPCFSSTRR